MNNFLNKFVRNSISIALTQKTGNTVNQSIFKFKNKYRQILQNHLWYGKRPGGLRQHIRKAEWKT